MRKPGSADGRRNRQAGFTLIEVTIASGLLAFEILAVIAMFSTATKANAFARHLTTATSLAQTRIEAAKNTPYANLSTPLTLQSTPTTILESIVDGDLTAYFDRNLQPLGSASGAVYTRKTKTTPNLPTSGMSLINVRVEWRDDSGNTHFTEITSAISQY